MSDSDLQRKEAIEKLKGERIELLEKIKECHEIVMEGGDSNIAIKHTKDLYEKIAIIDDQIRTLQALTSDIT